MNYNNITVVIQGPYDDLLLRSIDQYSKYVNVIISCYDTDNIESIKNKSCKIIQSELPQNSAFNRMHVYYQAFSSLIGVRESNTDFVLKTRCNEYYEDIRPILDKGLNNPDKMITNNIAFSRTSHCCFHPSDHMMFAKRDSLEFVFDKTMKVCEKIGNVHNDSVFSTEIIEDRVPGASPEVIFCMIYLYYKGIDWNKHDNQPETSKTIMKKHYDMVPVEDLGEVIWSIRHGTNRNYRRGNEGLYGYKHDSIKSMDEL